MARREIDRGAMARDEDFDGNNAAFTCPKCGKVFLVNQFLRANGRVCPECEQSTGYVIGEGEAQRQAFIEWGGVPSHIVTGRIVGYDPGGDRGHGVASMVLQDGRPKNLAFRTAQNAQAVLEWFNWGRTPILAVVVDTLTVLSTGDAGWRPADRWLRQRYPDVQRSVMPPNALLGAMVVNGLAVISRLRDTNPNMVISETHPRVLYHHLTNGSHYDYDANRQAMNSQLAQWIGLPANTEDDHQWDAVVSCLAALQGITGRWPGDLHNQLPPASDETPVRIVGPTHYYWPILPA